MPLQLKNQPSYYDIVQGGSYKIYVALLSQPGDTSNPTHHLLKNTLNGTVTWTRVAAGLYLGTLDHNGFTVNKTLVFMGNTGGSSIVVSAYRTNPNEIQVITGQDGVDTDGLMANTPIEIRVYN